MEKKHARSLYKKLLFTVHLSSPHPYPRFGTQPAPATSCCLVLDTGALETRRRPIRGRKSLRPPVVEAEGSCPACLTLQQLPSVAPQGRGSIPHWMDTGRDNVSRRPRDSPPLTASIAEPISFLEMESSNTSGGWGVGLQFWVLINKQGRGWPG